MASCLTGLLLIILVMEMKVDTKIVYGPPGHLEVLIENQLAVKSCYNLPLSDVEPTKLLYATGDRAVLMTWEGGAWVHDDMAMVNAGCTSFASEDPCAEYVAPMYAMSHNLLDPKLKALSCHEGFAWASSSPVPYQLAQCTNGTWLQPLDMCWKRCLSFRDCTEIAEANSELMSGYYYIYPAFGMPSGPREKVYCKMDVTAAYSGWTEVLVHANGTLTADQWVMGNTTMPFFIGLNILSLLHQTNRTLTYKFVLENDASSLETIYGSVMLEGHPNFTLTQVERAHGEAGDSLSRYVGRPFICIGTCWWVPINNSTHPDVILGADSVTWPTSPTLFNVMKLYVRTEEFDLAHNCPPILITTEYWPPKTEVTGLTDRSLGSVITYRCEGEHIYEGPEEGPFTKEGTVTCIEDGSGNLLWDRELHLPCKFGNPPPPFFVSDQRDRFYYFSNTTASSFYNASSQCNLLGSSLATIDYLSNLRHCLDGATYYTAHTTRHSVNVTPPIPPTATCDPALICEPTPDLPCVIFTQYGFGYSSCREPHNYICMIEAYCPSGYAEVDGKCYRTYSLPDNPTAFESYSICQQEGASLLHLYNENEITKLVQVKIMEPDVLYYTGFYSLDYPGFPTGPMYASKLPTLDPGFFLAVETINSNQRFTAVDANVSYSAQYVCQYPGPGECLTEPVDALWYNMTRTWNGSYAYGTVIVYECDLGYFADGDTAVTIQKVLCQAQLGEWFPEVKPCLRVEVCFDELPVSPSPLITEERDPTLGYLGDSITFYCPEDMATEDLLLNQTFTCSKLAVGFGLDPEPLIKNCTVCVSEPTLANGTTTWVLNNNYSIGQYVDAECPPDHHVEPGFAIVPMYCEETGWQDVVCYEGCLSDPPLPGSNMTAEENTVGAIGSTLLYKCDPGLYVQTPEGPKVSLVIECHTDHLWTNLNFKLDCVEVCMGDPYSVVDAVSTWDGIQRAFYSEVQYECPAGYTFLSREPNITVTCENDGFWTPMDEGELDCYEIYHFNHGYPQGNYTAIGDIEPYIINQTVTFECPEGQYTQKGLNSISITATPTGWTKMDRSFLCMDACLDDPTIPPASSLANLTWDGLDRTVGTKVSYTCPPGYNFVNRVDTLNSECTVFKNWTDAHEPFLQCKEVIPDDPPAGPANVTIKGDDAPYFVDQVVTYECPEGQFTLKATNSTQVKGISGGWTELDPEFQCYDALDLVPPPPLYGLKLEGTLPVYVVGSKVNYTCKDSHNSSISIKTFTLTATPNGWDPKYSPLTFFCTDPNAPPPPTTTETPLEMFDKNVFDEAYEITSDNHMPSIENFMGTVNGPEYVLTDGPFGFGYAIRLNTPEQCMKRSPYATPDDCTSDPKTCTKGFTIGIWERVNISFNVFYTVHKYPEDRKRYILSTGGDEFGHPGIALYHQGLAIIGLVSTGDEYWQVDVLGNFDVNEWYHIALRFIASVGLEMFKDGKKVGHCHMSKNSAPRLALLNPSELLVGCHRDADNTNYRDYNNADFDEFATWNRRLADSELSYLRGGNEEKVENLSPEECAHMLSKTDLKDSKQADIAMNMLNAMADTIPVVEESDNTTDTVKYNGTVKPLDAAGLKLKGIADVIHEVTKPKVIRDTYTVEDLDTYFKVVETASKILDESYAEQWHAIEESGHRGARGVKEDMERYVDIIASRIPLDKKNPQPMSYIKTTDNIMVKIEKMSIKDFREIGGTYATPDYREDGMEDLYREWDLPFDKVKVPTDLFSDPRCQMHPVSIVTCFYDSYDDVQSSEVISDQITPEGGLELGSRVLRVNISIDKPLHRKGHPKYYECHFDPKKVDKARIRFNLENKLKMPQLRALSFHHNELQTPVKQRLCIWWNTVINGWDTAGCKVLDTTSLNTKCVCRHWGTVATLVEFVEEKYPPYESDTAKYVKLFLYIISDICLLIYILVVFLAGDLKDQFHISGAALSVSVIGGSTALLISDSENIQSDRHNCAAMGTLIQGFYLMSGGWVAMLGHAGFKAVSKGIITGRLKSYCLISSGIALAVVGVSYAFYIHDMGTDPRCFIAWDDNLKLILFFCPLMCFLCVGVFFACVIFFNIRHAKKLNKAIETDLSSFILGSTYVMIYYFIVWVVGILSYIHFDGEYLGCYPTFQILNSLVGVVILLSLGIHSLKFRRVLTAASKRRGEMLQKMKETANKAKPKALNKPKGNNAKAPPAKAPPPSKPSTNPPPTQPPANPPPPQAPPKPPTPAPPAKPPTPQPPADLCPPAENPSQQAADLLDL